MSNRKRARKALSLATSAALAAGLMSGLAAAPSSAVVEGFSDTYVAKGLRAGVEQYTSIDWIDNDSTTNFNFDGGIDGGSADDRWFFDYDIDDAEITPISVWNFNSTDGLPEANFDAGNDDDYDDYIGYGEGFGSGDNDWVVNLEQWPADSSLQNNDFTVLGGPSGDTSGIYALILAPNQINSSGSQDVTGDVAQNIMSYADPLSAGTYVINVRDTISGFNQDITVQVGSTPVRGTLVADETTLPIEWEDNLNLSLFDSAGVLTSFDPDRSESFGVSETGGNIFTDGSNSGYGDFNFETGSYDSIYFSSEEVGTARVWAEIDLPSSADDFDSNSVVLTTKDWVSEVGDCTDGAVAANGVAVQNFQEDGTTCQNNDVYVRTGINSVNFYYAGGSANADKFVGRYDYDAALEFYPVLTNASGAASFSVSMTGYEAGDYIDTGLYTWGANADDFDDSSIVLNVEDSGYAPHYALQGVSGHYNDDDRNEDDWNYDNFNDDDYNYFVKSLVVGQDFTVSYKVTDIWGTPIQGLNTYLDKDGDSSDKLEITEANGIYKETDSNGVVSFNVDNNYTVADLRTSDNENNEQEPETYSYDWAEFFAEPAELEYDGPFSSEVLYHEYLRSVTPASVDISNATTSGSAIDVPVNGINTSGGDQSAVEARVYVKNADGLWIYGVPVTVSASANGFVSVSEDVSPNDVSEMSSSSTFISGWNWTYVYMTATKVGDAAFTVSTGTDSAIVNQAFQTEAAFARYLNAVDSSVTVEAGEIAKAEFHVTDRFANPISGITVNMVGNILGAGSVSAVSDSNGKVAVDVTTPVKLTVAQIVTATATGSQFGASANGAYGVPAGNGVATATVSSAETPAPLPTIKVVGVKGAARVWVYGAEAGDVVRTKIDGRAKAVRVVRTDDSVKAYKLSAGKHTIKIRVITDRGTVTKTVKVNVKKK